MREQQAQKEKQKREEKERQEQQKQHKINERKQKRKQKLEKDKNEKKEVKRRTHMRKELAFLKKTTAAKDIKDEDVLERNGFTIARKEVATGSYSKLFTAKQTQNEAIVCKVIILDKCPQKYKQLLLSESLKIERYVGSGGEDGCAKHTNYCKVFDIFTTNTKVYIFVDECQSLSIETRLKNGDTISEDEAKRWVRQVAEAMSYLHSIGVSHKNLQPENVIFDKENGIKVVGLDMTSIYWDSDMEQVIT